MKSINSAYWGDDPRFFIGKVVRKQDPKQMGRVQVRIFGIHDNLDIEPQDLPWAQTLLPVTSPGISGDGENAVLGQGAMVYGVFLDGKLSQIPLVLGSFVTIQNPSAIQETNPTLAGDITSSGGTYVSSPGSNPDATNISTSSNAVEIDKIAGQMIGSDTAEKIFVSLCNKMDPTLACAFLGNMRAESGPGRGQDYNDVYNRPNSRNTRFQNRKFDIKGGPWSEKVNENDVGLPAFGLCQWRGDRWEKLMEYSESREVGLHWQSLQAQCQFVWHECIGSENTAWGYILSNKSDIANATYSVCRFYERPSFQFVRYGTSEFGACPYSEYLGSHDYYHGRKYWSSSLNKRIDFAKAYYRKYVQGL